MSARRSVGPTHVGLLLALSLGFACTRKAAVPAVVGGGGSVTIWTDSTELFMEHPPLIVGTPDKFAVHLTDVTDFAPLRGGHVRFEFAPRTGGAPIVIAQDTPRSPGIYGPAPTFREAGLHDLTILIEAPQIHDTVRVRGLTVYPSAAATPPPPPAPAGGIPFLKEQQWKTPGFVTAFAGRGSVNASFHASGNIVPAAGRYAEVSAPIGGLVETGGVAESPSPGQRVRRGQLLAVLTPSLSDGGNAYAEARARLREAEDEYARAQRLFAAEAIPQRRLHDAGIRLQAAREALSGMSGGMNDSTGQFVIRAPIPGTIASRDIAPGKRVEAGATLFSIIDPAVVWLEVHVPASDAPRVRASSGATFRVERLEREYRAGRVISVGNIIDSVSRTLPVIYEVPNPDGSLKVGATARVAVRTGEHAEGVVIPSSAVLDEDGRPIAYVQVQGELFEKRQLTVGGEDNGRTLVLSGVTEEDRVVTGAAYQVRLASLSSAVPAHGHEH
ncbi:MAG: efflux RND transporter periplasmic adaptor subunit [Gemmatimonadetes bacterium]|nr:efflux RND transporter periplasmic adaptor subunit [Gemmatimonadota bacterium]